MTNAESQAHCIRSCFSQSPSHAYLSQQILAHLAPHTEYYLPENRNCNFLVFLFVSLTTYIQTQCQFQFSSILFIQLESLLWDEPWQRNGKDRKQSNQFLALGRKQIGEGGQPRRLSFQYNNSGRVKAVSLGDPRARSRRTSWRRWSLQDE